MTSENSTSTDRAAQHSPDVASTAAYYLPLGGDRYLPTSHTEGAWASTEQHMAPASGLLAAAIEQVSGRADLITSRICFDILGTIHRREVQVSASVIRPGRTIELVQAEMSADGQVLIRGTAWRLLRSNTSSVAASELPPMPGPDRAEPWDGTQIWSGGFISGLEFRMLPDRRAGRGRAWVRTDRDLVQGRRSSDLAGYVGLIDTANGVAVRADPSELLFPNTDLTVHFTREPRGGWLGLDTSVSFGAEGIGITSSVLHDEFGPVGLAAQSLTIRRRS